MVYHATKILLFQCTTTKVIEHVEYVSHCVFFYCCLLDIPLTLICKMNRIQMGFRISCSSDAFLRWSDIVIHKAHFLL